MVRERRSFSNDFKKQVIESILSGTAIAALGWLNQKQLIRGLTMGAIKG